MHIKIQGGTANHGESNLCSTCRNATIVQGRTESEQIIECSELARSRRMPFAVRTCTEYDDRRMPSRWDMEQIAWVLRTDTKTRSVGFTKPSNPRRVLAFEDDE